MHRLLEHATITTTLDLKYLKMIQDKSKVALSKSAPWLHAISALMLRVQTFLKTLENCSCIFTRLNTETKKGITLQPIDRLLEHAHIARTLDLKYRRMI